MEDMQNNGNTRRQGIFWLLTVPLHDPSLSGTSRETRSHGAKQVFNWIENSALPRSIVWARGQLERGERTGYYHFQFILAFRRKQSLNGVKSIFGSGIHAELTRSEAANDYVQKEDTFAGYRFEYGTKPRLQSERIDWDQIWTLAVEGRLQEIPASIRVRSYRTLRQIEADHTVFRPIEKKVYVYWGKSGTGKSGRAWAEATMDAFPKDPCTKFWYGYRGQRNVVIDEFRGDIGISHFLRWLDRYPVGVEVKSSHSAPNFESIWITSNVSPDEWYPGLDPDTLAALKRRFTEVIHFSDPFGILQQPKGRTRLLESNSQQPNEDGLSDEDDSEGDS